MCEVGCARCHSGPQFTDSRLLPKLDSLAGGLLALPGGFLLHDVGTRKPASGQRLKDSLPGFDTPTLKGIWEFPPYLHDGKATTLLDVITTSNPHDQHGKTSQLSADEKLQIVAYLEQVDESESLPLALQPVHTGSAKPLRLWITEGLARGEMVFHVEGISVETPLIISIFTLAGQRVRVIEDNGKNFQATRSIAWNGLDRVNRRVNAGLFFVQATSGSQKTQARFSYTR